MASKTKKTLFFILVLLLGAAITGYFLWNKPHKNVADTDGIKVNASDLYQAFSKDSAVANAKYIDKVVEVTGTVKSISVNQQQQQVVILQTNTGDAAINCTFEQKNVSVKEGNPVKLKGICSGLGEGDADLGILGDLYLIRCYIAE